MLQQIKIPKDSFPLWKAVQESPVKMTEGCLISPAIKGLLEVGLVVYEDGALRLHKDCCFSKPE